MPRFPMFGGLAADGPPGELRPEQGDAFSIARRAAASQYWRR